MEDKFKLKSKVYFNKESIKLLSQIEGTRAFVVTDSIMEKLGYLQQIVNYLSEAGISSIVFSEVRPDPDVKVVSEGLKKYLDNNADVLIALGGGSAIDTAKGILYFAWKMKKSNGINMKKPLFVAIPSTSGTGSEVTDFTVITTDSGKTCIVDDFLAPDIAILDSTCIQHVPNKVVADTGIDVLVHALEAYVSTKATDFTDALAEKSVKLIFDNLEKLYLNPGDSDARDRVQNASCMAGMAFTNANLGINHSLAHALGGTFHIPHGRCNALLISSVMEYNAELSKGARGYATERYSNLAKLLQLPSRTIREGAVSLIKEVDKLKRKLGVENSIRFLGIDQKEFESSILSMAESAINDRCTETNPKSPNMEDIMHIYKKCY